MIQKKISLISWKGLAVGCVPLDSHVGDFQFPNMFYVHPGDPIFMSTYFQNGWKPQRRWNSSWKMDGNFRKTIRGRRPSGG